VTAVITRTSTKVTTFSAVNTLPRLTAVAG
jgi:hypothetical protein